MVTSPNTLLVCGVCHCLVKGPVRGNHRGKQFHVYGQFHCTELPDSGLQGFLSQGEGGSTTTPGEPRIFINHIRPFTNSCLEDFDQLTDEDFQSKMKVLVYEDSKAAAAAYPTKAAWKHMVEKVNKVVERMGMWSARMAFKRLVESHFRECLALEHIEKYEAISFVSRKCLRTGCPLLGMSTIMFNISLVPSVYFKVRRPSLLARVVDRQQERVLGRGNHLSCGLTYCLSLHCVAALPCSCGCATSGSWEWRN